MIRNLQAGVHFFNLIIGFLCAFLQLYNCSRVCMTFCVINNVYEVRQRPVALLVGIGCGSWGSRGKESTIQLRRTQRSPPVQEIIRYKCI